MKNDILTMLMIISHKNIKNDMMIDTLKVGTILIDIKIDLMMVNMINKDEMKNELHIIFQRISQRNMKIDTIDDIMIDLIDRIYD